MIASSIEKTVNFLANNPVLMALGLISGLLTAIISLALNPQASLMMQDYGSAAKILQNPMEMPSLYSGSLGLPGIVASLAGFLISTFSIAVIYRYMPKKDISAAINEAALVYFNLLAGRMLQFLIFMAAFILLSLAGIVIGYIIHPIFSMMVIIPLIAYLYIKLMFIDALICLKSKEPIESISESWKESEGFMLDITLTLLVFGVMLAIVYAIVYIAPSAALGMLYMNSKIGGWVMLIPGLLISALSPMTQILAVTIYLYIAREKEGAGKKGNMPLVPLGSIKKTIAKQRSKTVRI